MKKYLLLLAFISYSTISPANPIVPQAHISEIYIDSTGNWTIELGFFDGVLGYINSIEIETLSGSFVINSITFIPGASGDFSFDTLALITNTNLESPITIDPSYDYVKIISYDIWDYPNTDYIELGTYNNSYLDCLTQGESISFYEYFQTSNHRESFCIDKSPSVGVVNDSSGLLGTFRGQVMDLNGDPFTEGFFYFYYSPGSLKIYLNTDSMFSDRIFSRRYTFDQIVMYFPPEPYTPIRYTIEPIDICLRPDTVVNMDIITTGIVTGLPESDDNYQNTVITAPNPFTDKMIFYFNFDNFQMNDKIELLIHNQSGLLVERKILSTNQHRYEWKTDSSIKPGVYLYQMLRNNNIIKFGKIIKL